MPLKPSYLALIGVGGIVAVSGIRGWKIGSTFQDIISGKNPTTDAQLTAQITGASAGGPTTAAAGGATGDVASTAESLVGFPYTWGGAPANGSGDCSSFVNWVVGHLCGRAIPGFKAGTYTGTTHGPTTLTWLAWSGTGVNRVSKGQAQPGDLAVWQTHMGVIIDDGVNMVSDLNPSLGTLRTSIAGGAPPGEILSVLRLR